MRSFNLKRIGLRWKKEQREFKQRPHTATGYFQRAGWCWPTFLHAFLLTNCTSKTFTIEQLATLFRAYGCLTFLWLCVNIIFAWKCEWEETLLRMALVDPGLARETPRSEADKPGNTRGTTAASVGMNLAENVSRQRTLVPSCQHSAKARWIANWQWTWIVFSLPDDLFDVLQEVIKGQTRA